jgi:hypothetical protein
VNGFFTALAAHQRTHPGTVLQEWWPASRYAADGGLYEAGDHIDVALHTRIRPDASGMWAEHDRSVWFFLEYDTGTEPLSTLIDKIVRSGTMDDFEEFAVEIARGDAELATSPGPRAVNWQHICRTCRTIS